VTLYEGVGLFNGIGFSPDVSRLFHVDSTAGAVFGAPVRAGEKTPEARAIIVTAPGEEAHVDYGNGPIVRDAGSGTYRRARRFVLTLGFSRRSIRLLVMRCSTRVWAELHERAFRRLGAVPKVIVLDYCARAYCARTATIRCSIRSTATASLTTV
jgi:hypothetical protein